MFLSFTKQNKTKQKNGRMEVVLTPIPKEYNIFPTILEIGVTSLWS